MRKRNPWVSISDLLSSVVLILLLMFVLASILPRYTQEAERQEMMRQIEEALRMYEDKGQVKVHVSSGILEFTSVTFAAGSAELTPAAQAALADFTPNLKEYMDLHPRMEVLIEGHTDPSVVRTVVNKGGYFDNNIQLSSLRAANVRSSLLQNLGADYAGRVGVAGYGETRLKNKADPTAAENRRIEIRILWDGREQKNEEES